MEARRTKCDDAWAVRVNSKSYLTQLNPESGSMVESINQQFPGDEEALLRRALEKARDTQFISIKQGVRHTTASVFRTAFGDKNAVIITDENTYVAAGKEVEASFLRESRAQTKLCVFGPHVYANDSCARELVEAFRAHEGIPVAVGSGTINDLTKLAAHLVNRPYKVVGTAASMDGCSAFGASITQFGC